VQSGHLELLGLVEQIDLNDLGAGIVLNLSQLKGEMMALMGRLDDAETVLSSALDQCSADDVMRAQLLSSLADVARKVGNSDLALERHKQALSSYIQQGDALWAARTYNNIGYLLRRKKERSKALEAYGEVESILSSSDEPSLINSQITLARALIDLDELDRAKDHAIAAHERTAEGDDALLHARAQSVLGRYYAKIKQSELALFHYSAALEAMSDSGDLQSLVEVTILLGGVLHDAGKGEEAIDHYRQALVVAEANDMRMEIGELLTRLGGTSPDRQERMEYLQRALAVFRELGARSRMKEVQTMVHRAVMSR
jgi:tetratricopeptide (TPR) repeat protein